MVPIPLKTFVHPHKVYRLDYPSHWDQLVERDGESCGFGPHERDDVGLWISIMPVSVDTDRVVEVLPEMMRQALDRCEAKDLRADDTLRHYGLTADVTREGQGGHYWILAGGDVVLFASSQVPFGERDVWNPLFQRLVASLEVTRDKELIDRKVIQAVLAELEKRSPGQEFTVDGYRLRGAQQSIYLGNLCSEVRDTTPARREAAVKRFVAALTQPATADIGSEAWDDVQNIILPVLKPRAYIHPDGPTQALLISEWLADVVICYVIARNKLFRFVTGWDVNRWGITDAALHERAMANLANLPWPEQLAGSRSKSGRVIVIQTDDGLASSRLLHPDLHHLFAPPLGNTFWAGIPCRDRLVVYSDRRPIKQRIERRLTKDYKTSAYPLTPKPFLVTRDGIAPPT